MKNKGVMAIILAFALTVPVTTLVQANPEQRNPKPYLMYTSEIELDYDHEALQNISFDPSGPPVTLKITIRSKIDVPAFLLHSPLVMLKAWYLIGSYLFTARTLNLSVLNPPSWAAVSINPQRPAIDFSNTWQETRATLTIACYSQAPAEPYTLYLKADLPALKRLSSATVVTPIIINPTWQPRIEVYVETPNIITPPNQITNVSITVTNLANGWTLVGTNITDNPGWNLTLDPAEFTIEHTYQSAHTTLHIMPPDDFNGTDSILIYFTPSHLEKIGQPVPVYIQATYLG